MIYRPPYWGPYKIVCSSGFVQLSTKQGSRRYKLLPWCEDFYSDNPLAQLSNTKVLDNRLLEVVVYAERDLPFNAAFDIHKQTM
jgi:hypothetical protein